MPGPQKPIVDFGSPGHRDILERAKSGAPPVGGAPMPKIPGSPGGSAQGSPSVAVPPAPWATEQRPADARPAEPNVMTPAPGQQFANPPRPPGSGLRPETIEGVKDLEQAMAKQMSKSSPPPAAGAKEEDDLKREIEQLDEEFDFDEFGNRLHSLLQNKPRRTAIEGRCDPIRLEDLITYQEVRQRVPIVPSRYEPTFRSPSGAEDIWVKRKMSGTRGSEMYIQALYALYSLTTGLHAINGIELPTHLKDGEVNDDLFEAKYRRLLNYPSEMLADLSVNFAWFGTRVKKLLVFEQIKGF